MNRGYVKLWRKSLEGGWLQNPELWTFWTWCLLKASHKVIVVRVGFQEITLEPGQFVFGRLKASKELKMSERKIRSCIDFLRKAENLTIKTTNKFSIITIVNWTIYQGDDLEYDQQNGQPATSKRPQTRINKKNIYPHDQESQEVLAYLNEKKGSHFKDDSNIRARLKGGGTVEECKRIIDVKMKDSYFLENPKYLNPETLFRKKHWDKYLNEADSKLKEKSEW